MSLRWCFKMAEWRDGIIINYKYHKPPISIKYKILKITRREDHLIYADYWCYNTNKKEINGMFYIDEFVIESWPAIRDVSEFNLDV